MRATSKSLARCRGGPRAPPPLKWLKNETKVTLIDSDIPLYEKLLYFNPKGLPDNVQSSQKRSQKLPKVAKS